MNIRLHYVELLRAIELCWEHRLYGPMLMLLYSSIDALAWLGCRLGEPEVKPGDFTEWVDRYLIPDSGLPCTAADLYSARCGLVHSLTPDARNIRKGYARQIYYAVGPNRAMVLQYAIENSPEPAVAVQLESLLSAFREAFTKFFDAAESDSELMARIESRRSRIFVTYTDGPTK
jgi:hypothetical protein